VTATASAVLVPVPEAEPVVGAVRSALDAAAGWGVPAHVTVLFPFVPPAALDDGVRAALAEAVASVRAFDVVFARTAWFGDRVVWLAPEPAGPFRALTEAVCARFPDYPPYGGEYPDHTPHLTLGHDAPLDVLRAAARDVATMLPVRARVSGASLWTGAPESGGWRRVAEFPLAGT
jgi:2'-5' RNA ligase